MLRALSILLLSCLMAKAELIHFSWDASVTPFVSDYFLYAGNLPASTNSYIARVQVSAPATNAYLNLPNGTVSVWVTSAFPGGPESAPSTPLTFTVPVSVSCTLAASPTSIAYGDSTDLTWAISGAASSASIDGGVGAVDPVSGTVSVSPSVTTTYTLTASNALSTNTCTATVTVGLPLAVSLLASPSIVISNSPVTLTWSSTGPCDHVAFNHSITNTACSGSLSITPTTNTTYTVIAYDAALNSVTNSASVTVIPAPTPPSPSGGLAAFRRAVIIR